MTSERQRSSADAALAPGSVKTRQRSRARALLLTGGRERAAALRVGAALARGSRAPLVRHEKGALGMKQKLASTSRGWQTLAVLSCVQASACGATSADERWEPDDLALEGNELAACDEPAPAPDPEGTESAPPSAGNVPTCPHVPFEGYGYAELPSFWLGEQAVGPVAVQGPGYMVMRTVGPDALDRFSRETEVFVAPDGTLEDAAGRTLLGHASELADTPYAPTVIDQTCLTAMRAPAQAPPAPTRGVYLVMNLDARDPTTTFVLEDPDGTSNHSVSFMPFDSHGQSRYLDLYFQHVDASTWTYHALVDGSDLEGGVPGAHVEVGAGSLSFTADGALASAITPDICPSFVHVPQPAPCLSIDFGWAIADGGNGLSGTTRFASPNEVRSLWFDGVAPGTAERIGVAENGLVRTYFDNGTSASVGFLSLARFPSERHLSTSADGTLSATPSSGDAQLGLPGTPGRGLLSQGTPTLAQ
jgi:flagellar hook-basal body protein